MTRSRQSRTCSLAGRPRTRRQALREGSVQPRSSLALQSDCEIAMSNEFDNRLPDTHRTSDVTHAVIRGVISTIPVVGGVAAEVFGLIVTAPMEQRKNDWMEAIHERVRRLEAHG